MTYPGYQLGLAIWFAPTLRGMVVAIGGVFLLSAVPKLRHPSRFSAAVERYDLVSRQLVPWVAGSIVLAESLVAAGLLLGIWWYFTLPAACALVLIFAGAIVVTLRRNSRIECGCFGDVTETVSLRSLVRIALLLVATVTVFASYALGLVPSAVVPTDAANVVSPFLFETTMIGVFFMIMAHYIIHAHEVVSLLQSAGLPRRRSIATLESI